MGGPDGKCPTSKEAGAVLPEYRVVERIYMAANSLLSMPVTHFYEKRSHLLFLVCAMTGARIGEVLNLRKSDIIETTNERYFLRIKTEKRRRDEYRAVPIPRKLAMILRMYAGRVEGDRLFQISYTQAYYDIRRASRELLGCELHPHLLRHAYVVYLFSSKRAHPEDVRRWAGHADMRTTLEIYGRYATASLAELERNIWE